MNGFDPIENRRQRAAERTTTTTTETPVAPVVQESDSLAASVYKPFYKAGILTSDEEARKKRSTGRVIGEDLLSLALAPSALVGMVGDTLIHPEKTPETVYNIGKGFVQGFIEPFKGQVWKDRPVSNTVNVIGDISIIGGLAKSFALQGARTSAITAAKEAAVKAGADSVLVDSAFSKSKLFGKVKMTNPILKNAMTETVKLNSVAPFESGLKVVLKSAGLEEEIATNIAKEIANNNIGTWLSENISKMRNLDKVVNPLKIFGKDSLVSQKIQKAVFGGTEKSAVGKLYGSDVVKQDIKGFGLTEEWASNQVFEKGLEDTLDNRIRVIEDWVESNPEYASLSPLERNKHLAHYAEVDLKRKTFAQNTGGNYVLTKKLSTDYTESMIEYVKSLDPSIKNYKVIDELMEQYGSDFANHLDEIERGVGENINNVERSSLISSIEKLANENTPVNIQKLSTEEVTFLESLKGSGYRIGIAPGDKIISQSAELTGVMQSREVLLAERSKIGKVIDKLGLSPEGNVEGFQMFQFRENFNRLIYEKINKRTVAIGGTKIPLESVLKRLEKLRVKTLENQSGFKSAFSGKFTVADLRKSDLLKYGFSEKDASIVDSIIRESIITSPSIVGLGEALSNFVRTKDNILSRTYDSYMRGVSTGRFKLNPFFGAQSAIETVSWGSLWAKKNVSGIGLPYVERGMNLIRKGLNKPLIEANKIPTFLEENLVLEEVMGDYVRQLRDAGSPSEMFRGVMDSNTKVGVKVPKSGIAGYVERLKFQKKTQDSNVWLGMAGFSNVKIGTNMMKAYAKRFGMTLEEALDFKMVGTKKVYTNEWMVRNMKEAAQAVFGYKPGILTSPLIRTLNVPFFPMRFQTKTIMQTADWLGSLHPTTRAMVINEWTNMGAWLTTDEGKKWKNGNRGLFGNIFNYTFAFEGIGQSIDAVTRGKLFGGNVGQLGGLPFGFIFTIARDLGYTKSDVEINQATGKEYKRTVIKDTVSFASFVTAVEDILLSMTPSMPFSQATGGIVTPSVRGQVKLGIEQILTGIYAGVETTIGKDEDFKKNLKEIRKDISRQRINVKVDYTKKLPISLHD